MDAQSVISVRGGGLPGIETDFRPPVNGFPSGFSGSMLGMGNDTIGSRVRALRGDMSRPELAKLTGIPKTTIQTLEEKPQQSNKWLPRLATHFDVNLDWLITGRGAKRAGEPGQASQTVTLDPDTLHEALVLIDFDQAQAGPYPPRAYARRLAELYGRVASDGGRLSMVRTLEFEREVEARQNGESNAAHASSRRSGNRR